jgi:APA family basic amino acid/polyamine antiporter
MGEAGRDFVAGLVVFSCLGWLSVIIFTGPRLYYAMATEGLFFQRAGRLHPRFRTPGNTILLQSGMAVALLFTNSYDQLLSFVISTAWIFFALTAGAIFLLRRKRIGDATAFRVPGHPVTTIVFFLAAAAVVINTFVVAPRQSFTGLVILAVGLAVYGLFLRGRARFGETTTGSEAP